MPSVGKYTAYEKIKSVRVNYKFSSMLKDILQLICTNPGKRIKNQHNQQDL